MRAILMMLMSGVMGCGVYYECTCTSEAVEFEECDPELGYDSVDDPGAEGAVDAAAAQCCDANDETCSCSCDTITRAESETF